jgi:WD40 repeat protein
VTGVAVTPDGSRALSASFDGLVKVWDLTTYALIANLTGHTDRVYGVSVLPSGNSAISGSFDETTRVWDLETLQSTAVIQVKWKGQARQQEPSLKPLLMGVKGPQMAIRLPCKPTLTSKNVFRCSFIINPQEPNAVLTVASLPSGNGVIAGNFNGTIQVWTLAGSVTLEVGRGGAPLKTGSHLTRSLRNLYRLTLTRNASLT